ncbi:MAG: hypothetical protein KDE68_06590 [Rhodocyclaceae bacterium]|nr:hypothetical protein [Rhodocyclaceae bacterium]
MDPAALIFAFVFGFFALKTVDQRRRIALLGTHLQKYSLEKHMQTLSEGYLRALDADTPERQSQIWELMQATERALADQLERLAQEMARLDPDRLRISRLPLALPWVDRLFPGMAFDLRDALRLHARGIARAIEDQPGRSARDKAFTVLAEMYLFQHTCHWFCRSRTVASARLLARHKTAYVQVIAAVSPDTRRDYTALTAG